jgi:hypothetical protein
MRAPSLIITALVGLIVNVSVPAAHAATVTFVTPPGATTSGPVDASATFTTGANFIDVSLSNLQPNITDVAQALSNLSFTYSGSDLGVPLDAISVGEERTVAGNGTFTTGSGVPTGWAVTSLGSSTLLLNVLGTPTGPAHLIIGPPGSGGTYSNANGSIAGNGPHNPFLNQLADFEIILVGITADTTIMGATFSFGTTAGINVPGVPPTSPVPIPGALPLFATGLAGLGLLGWRRKKTAAG